MTVAPVAGLVKNVAGDLIPVTVLVPAGKEPETFMPTPSEMLEIAGCTLFFRVGLSSEDAVLERLKSINPNLRIVDLRDNLPVLNFDEGISDGAKDEELEGEETGE
ncbi:MAG: zinc ABC transporter substrate-binding protein, partial [Methanocorpusculum sp.]|nr:zinc ABC transporter substrate-binding protein [Methanocorpusculum sp.]